ncbi:MAG: DUF2958 domain-containing protein [Bacteroidota bacterium]
MKLLTQALFNKLLENGRAQNPVRGTKDEIDFKPVVKLFTPDANCTWLHYVKQFSIHRRST